MTFEFGREKGKSFFAVWHGVVVPQGKVSGHHGRIWEVDRTIK